jgi:hypothetical protein
VGSETRGSGGAGTSTSDEGSVLMPSQVKPRNPEQFHIASIINARASVGNEPGAKWQHPQLSRKPFSRFTIAASLANVDRSRCHDDANGAAVRLDANAGSTLRKSKSRRDAG